MCVFVVSAHLAVDAIQLFCHTVNTTSKASSVAFNEDVAFRRRLVVTLQELLRSLFLSKYWSFCLEGNNHLPRRVTGSLEATEQAFDVVLIV